MKSEFATVEDAPVFGVVYEVDGVDSVDAADASLFDTENEAESLFAEVLQADSAEESLFGDDDHVFEAICAGASSRAVCVSVLFFG